MSKTSLGTYFLCLPSQAEFRKHCLIKKLSYGKKKEEEAYCFPRKEDAAAMDDAAGTHDSREGWFDVVPKFAAGIADLQTTAGAW